MTEGSKCSVCGETLVAQETIDALGHTAGAEATCTEDQICTVCRDVLVEALGHKLNTVGICGVCGSIEATGFVTSGDDTYYLYEDGKVALGFKKIGNDYYYFHNATGKMYKDTERYLKADMVEGTGLTVGTYYFGEDGKMVIPEAIVGGWSEDGWFYYDENGNKVTGLQFIEGSYYYFNLDTGSLRKSATYVGTNDLDLAPGKYEVAADGKLIIPEAIVGGWSEDGWFYYDENGNKVTGLQYIDGNYYFFNLDTGALRKKTTFIGKDQALPSGNYEVDPDNGYALIVNN